MELLKRGLAALGITEAADSACLKRFEDYMNLLLEWNTKMNLTAITKPEDIINKHFIDSAAPLAATGFEQNAKLLDIGSGAGFPGIPLKLLRPDLALTLLDSLGKRIRFLDELIKVLELSNTCAVKARAEEAANRIEYREKYDIVCARAVARLSVLVEYSLPFVKIGGKFISLKGFDINDELMESEKAVSGLGGRIESVVNLNIPDTDISRSVIIVRKINQTPPKYPRSYNKIIKNPIL